MQQVSWRRRRATGVQAVQGAGAEDGLGNLRSGLLGISPNTTCSSCVAVTELIGVASRPAGICIEGLFLASAFVPEVMAATLAVPDPVVTAYTVVLMAMLILQGMRIVVQDGIDYRNSVVVGPAFWPGVGFQDQHAHADSFGGTLESILGNGMTAGGPATLLMILMMALAKPRRKRVEEALDLKSLPPIMESLRGLAKSKKWAAAATGRGWAAAEEAIRSLAQGEAPASQQDTRCLLLAARADKKGRPSWILLPLPCNGISRTG